MLWSGLPSDITLHVYIQHYITSPSGCPRLSFENTVKLEGLGSRESVLSVAYKQRGTLT